jgi:hypothetical protein
MKRRSIVATRQVIESRPEIESLERIYVGERASIGDEPIVITRLEVDGDIRILEGWHARTGQLFGWRWEEAGKKPKVSKPMRGRRKSLGVEA